MSISSGWRSRRAGRRRASYEMITDLNKVDDMRKGIDIAAEMVQHAQPLAYDPTIPVFTESFADESCCDAALAGISGAESWRPSNAAVQGLETQQILLSGVFSSGVNTVAQINTRSEHTHLPHHGCTGNRRPGP